MASNPGWIIDRDLLFESEGDGRDETGTVGPSGFEGDPASFDIKFRMYDDDDELYYEGRMNQDAMDDGFAEGWGDPLDDFGTPNAGCTRLDYLEDGTWKTL